MQARFHKKNNYIIQVKKKPSEYKEDYLLKRQYSLSR